MSHQYISPSAKTMIDTALSQVGYHEGRDPDGNWNNHQKYSPAVPSLGWSQNQAWCATFISWCAMVAKFAALYPCTASTDNAAAWWKTARRWSQYPAVAGQGFLGRGGDMFHTFLVVDFDDTYVYTVEGNTNDNGSAQGDGVYRLKRPRNDPRIEGYGLPKFTEGIVTADPKFTGKRATKPKATVPSKPAPAATKPPSDIEVAIARTKAAINRRPKGGPVRTRLEKALAWLRGTK